MDLVDTKDDRLVHRSYLPEYLRSYEVGPLIDDDRSIKVTREIDSLGILTLEDHISTRESELIDIELDPLDLEGCEKSIIDPLSEGVLIDRRSKVGVGIDIVITLWGRGESEVDRWGKISEDLCPVAILSRTASMTLIDDDKVKKISLVAIVVWLEDLVWMLFTRSS